jgi:hypothetical protein
MKKITNSILGLAIFIFAGCGTDPQGIFDSGLPNDGMLKIPQQNQGQEVANREATIDGIWYLFYDKTANNQIDIRNYSELLELDRQGKVYDISTGQKREIARFELPGYSQVKLIAANGAENTIRFDKVANEEGNCFYTTRIYGNQQRYELWCKKPGTGGGQSSQIGSDARPQLLQPEGYPVDLKEYLYPDQTVRVGGTTTEYIHNYEKTQDGTLKYNGRVIKSFKKVIDPQNNQIIQEFVNNSTQPKKEDIIYADKIDSYAGLSVESYTRNISKNSLVTEVSSDDIDLRCVVQDIIGGTMDLSSEIPELIQNHLKSQVTGSSFQDNQFTYTGVVHIRCGTTTGETIDSYNVNGWGEVLAIYNYADNTSRYEILDKYSIQY